MKRKQAMALLMTGMLVFQLPISSMAENRVNGTTITGDVYDATTPGKAIITGAEATDGSSLTVNGDAKSYVNAGALAEDKGSSVTVNGNVEGNSAGAYANKQGQVTVNGNVEGLMSGVQAQDGGTVTVNNGDIVAIDTDGVGVKVDDGTVIVNKGDVSATGANGVGIEADGGTVEVNGNINGYYEGIVGNNGTDITVNGNVSGTNFAGVSAVDKDTDITVDGNVSGGLLGIHADMKGKVHVTGDVSAVKTIGLGVQAFDGASVQVDGNIYGASGIYADNGTVVVKGNVEGKAKQAIVTENVGAFILVEGDAKGCDDIAIKLNLASSSWDDSTKVEVMGSVNGKIEVVAKPSDTVGQSLNKTGKIIVSELNASGIKPTDLVTVTGNDSIAEALAKKIAEQKIFYIVNTEKVQNGTITITQTSDMSEVLNADGSVKLDAYGNKLLAANQNKEITVKIVPDQGYMVKSADAGKAALVRKEDGSYVLTVPAGGGINICALIEKISEKEKETTEKENETTEKTPSKESSSKKPSSKNTSGSNAAAPIQGTDTEEVMYIPLVTVETDLTEQIANRYYGDIITAVMKTEKPVADEVAVACTAAVAKDLLVITDQEEITDDMDELHLNIDRELVKALKQESINAIQFVIESHKITIETEKLALIQDQYGCKKIVIHVTKNKDGSLNSEVTIDITSVLEMDMTEE